MNIIKQYVRQIRIDNLIKITVDLAFDNSMKMPYPEFLMSQEEIDELEYRIKRTKVLVNQFYRLIAL